MIGGTWTSFDGADLDGFRRRLQKYKQLGLTHVFLGGGVQEDAFKAVKEAGLELHCWMWTTNRNEPALREQHPEWFMVSRSGKSCADQPPYVGYYRWLSPAIPEVCDYISARAAELASNPLVDGVHLDYVRFPDVILPKALWETYGLDQTEELSDYDFCYSEATRALCLKTLGFDPLKLDQPDSHAEWINFRQDLVVQLVQRIAGEVKAKGKQTTAAVFPTPSMARRICRQAWDRWPLDAFCPMIYHSFYNEEVDWIGTCLIENVRAVSSPVIAGLYMPAFAGVDDFRQGLEICRRRGAKGVSLFGDPTEEQWQVFSRFLAERPAGPLS